MKITKLLILVFTLAVGCSAVCAQEPQKCDGLYGTGKIRFSLATGSPGELGLLKVLGEAFSKKEDASLCWIKAGSGESLKLLKDNKVDMIMVHAPDAEKQAILQGWAKKRLLIGSNEFFIVGPENDPAGIAQAKLAGEAYSKIAQAKAKFFSRGDNSGTHKKETDIWKKANIEPSGDWYIVTKDFMTATLKRTDAEKGYFMTDSSTWAAEKKNVPNLKILFRGDKYLVNTYHTLLRNDDSPSVKTAEKFIDFVASPDGQAIIRDFGKDQFGDGLYNDAEYAKTYDE